MPITNTNVSVLATNPSVAGTTALHAGHKGSPNDPCPVTVYNPGTCTLFVGGPTVTTANGIAILAGTSMAFNLVDGDILYGITSTVTTTVNVMRGRS